MKNAINEAARALRPIIYTPGKTTGIGEQIRQFLVRVTDERPELFKNVYLMKSAADLQKIYPVLDIEAFYEHKRTGDDRIFNAYEKALRAFTSSGDPKDALRALRPQDIEARDRFHRMIHPDQFESLGISKGGIYEVLIELDLMAGSSLAEFVRSGQELVPLHEVRYEVTKVLDDLGIRVETRDDYLMVMSNRDKLMAQVKVQEVARKLSSAVSRFVRRDDLDYIQPENMRAYWAAKSEEHKRRPMVSAALAFAVMPDPEDLTILNADISSGEEMDIADIKDILANHEQHLAFHLGGARTFEDLLTIEEDSFVDFQAGMDSSRLLSKLGRLPYADEKVSVKRDETGMILSAQIDEENAASIEL
jgi:hypothetical protein